MAVTENKMIRDFVDAIKTGTKEKTKAYETPATVTRIEDGVAWVHVPGGAEETPVQLTIAASEGDEVRVRVANGRATIVGNVTSPPTDDATAMKALSNANIAHLAAQSASSAAASAEASATAAKVYAKEAKETTDEINAYAETVGKTVTQVLEDGETAGAAAEQAKISADTAWVNLSQVQSVLEVAEWIATHGTYVKATTFNPNATYYTLTATQVASPSDDDKDSEGVLIYYELDNGIYVRTTDTSVQSGKTYYNVIGTPVSQPDAEHIADYYTLNVTDAMADYIKSHLALTDDGLYVMADDSEWKVLVADNGVYILDPNNRSANQMTGSGNIIGYDDETHVEIDYHSMQLIDAESNAYFHVSDLRKRETVAGSTVLLATLTESEIVTYSTYQSFFTAFHIYSVESVKVNGTAVTWIRALGTRIDLDQPCEIGDTVEVVYKTTSQDAKAYTLGKRADGTIGALSFVTGKNNIASGNYSFVAGKDNTAGEGYSFVAGEGNKAIYYVQTVIGEYNAPAFRPFIIGNGESDTVRSNALTVSWDGNVEMALDTTATSGVDKEIYDALVSLGWDSDVIV